MTRWLAIIGVGDDGTDGLSPPARALLDAAEIIVGSERLLGHLSRETARRYPWTSPLSDMISKIADWKGRAVVVLATGDPMHFGVGVTLLKHFPADEVTILPAPSAFSLAAARLGWPLQDVETVSLHGRPAALIQPLVQPGARVLALTEGGETVGAVAEMLRARGYGPSRLTVLEHMGGGDERQIALTANDRVPKNIAAFSTLAVECVARGGATVLPRVPGLPDDAFVHDGQLTKRDVRAITVASLGPVPGALLWDLGAGCGSVAIEWMRAARGARAVAFERKAERIAMMAENATALGAPDLEIVEGELPATLDGRASPHALFIGGAVSDASVFEAAWAALGAGGRCVANAVTLEGEAALIDRHRTLGGELVRIGISEAAPVGRLHAMRPRMSVLQWRATKS
ncbi:MAG: precorrin-6y C5,15-methyltransferase (decarboxylating) subunit CbiE [Hyphomicrobiales bacterium]